MKRIISTPLHHLYPYLFYCYGDNFYLENLIQILDKIKDNRTLFDSLPFCETIESPKAQGDLWSLVKNHIGIKDLQEIGRLKTLKGKQDYLVSRIAMKDAVCSFLKKERGENIPPHELYATHNSFGQPVIRSSGGQQKQLDSLFISLSHKDNRGVAIVSCQPVGIDIEKIEGRSEEFIQFAYTKKEISLLEDLDSSNVKRIEKSEALIRFWVAKESCAKKTGRGFQGKPQSFEVTGVEGDVIRVGDTFVQTTKIDEDYIVGWTL